MAFISVFFWVSSSLSSSLLRKSLSSSSVLYISVSSSSSVSFINKFMFRKMLVLLFPPLPRLLFPPRPRLLFPPRPRLLFPPLPYCYCNFCSFPLSQCYHLFLLLLLFCRRSSLSGSVLPFRIDDILYYFCFFFDCNYYYSFVGLLTLHSLFGFVGIEYNRDLWGLHLVGIYLCPYYCLGSGLPPQVLLKPCLFCLYW